MITPFLSDFSFFGNPLLKLVQDLSKPKKVKRTTISQPVIPSTTQTTTVRQSYFSFSSTQRTQLTNLLVGRVVRNEILSVSTRNLITNQLNSLPPGIQKRLVRGKGLPPGIAKKVFLPKTVNTYLNIPSRYDLIVIGSNVVVCDSVTTVVVDLITRFI
ncbi:MAG TPA: hypothetical protein IGS53_16380 [Leptolyngbyaceae cyanobacterium M33_DOE_097]|uniref:Uncharacterized protein n=1 Tax=Oscillatoriales cyanobacterium SpSt-418 TaxID=2282169 RepID=A0A7C3KF21_9CYAN|nr:hypothetical protein [Leptolyngbyaceae cyanobacterium M33_DOE_097]